MHYNFGSLLSGNLRLYYTSSCHLQVVYKVHLENGCNFSIRWCILAWLKPIGTLLEVATFVRPKSLQVRRSSFSHPPEQEIRTPLTMHTSHPRTYRLVRIRIFEK